MSAPRPAPPATTKQPFDKQRARRLLGMYVFGVAIGCVLVGVMLNAKRYFRPPPAPAPAGAPVAAPGGPQAPSPDAQPAAPAPAPQGAPAGS